MLRIFKDLESRDVWKKVIGNCIRSNIMTKVIIKMRAQRPRKKNVRRATKTTGR